MVCFALLRADIYLTCLFLGERPYDPRPYDSRYSRDLRDDRRGGRYDEYRGGRYEDRDRHYGRGDRDRER